ncbi:MAG TPA: hypothetical protein VKP65_03705 [Rhodothermales bacterium]|nr:hypothetical protein [Rhodothermales bacterium]
MAPLPNILRHRPLLVELFTIANLAFLVLDVYVAHSVNAFHHWAEWIPLFFAAAGTLVLILALAQERGDFTQGMARTAGLVVGWGAIAVGIGGLLLHLSSNFFQIQTLRTLVYSAPFIAPLAFTGLGFLLLLNRMVATDTTTWSKWVLLLAWGGFVGNFLLSLVDHAQNGFFYATEWIPVVVSALAVGYLFAVIVRPPTPAFLKGGFFVLGLQVLTGLVGFVLHLIPVVTETGPELSERIIYGAPVFAPLLFADLAVLAALGLWDLQTKLAATRHEVAAV